MLNLKFFDGFNLPDKDLTMRAEYIYREKDDNDQCQPKCGVHHDILTDCNEHSVKKLDHYKEEDLSNYKCIDFKKIEEQCRQQTKNSKFKVTLGGLFTDKIRGFLRITVANYTLGDDRKVNYIARETDLDIVRNVYFHIRYPSPALNNQLPTDPLKTVTYEEQHFLNKDT